MASIERITALRAPVAASEILLSLSADIQIGRTQPQVETGDLPIDENLPPRLFSSEQLAMIGQHSSAVKCECPQHLSQLLESLSAFEEYSRECENRNEQDAELHGFLHSETAQCRHRMELALEELMKREGIEI